MADAQETQINDKVIECDGGTETISAEKKDEGTSLEVKSPSKNAAKSPTKSPAKSPKKTPAGKSPVKIALSSPKKPSKEESEDEDEEEEEDEKKGLFDLPVVVEGKRKRESTSFLKVEENLSHKHTAPNSAGSGIALGNIPFIAHQLDSEKKLVDLRPLYRICFGTQGKMNLLRKELKTFNGYSFAKDSVEYKKKMELANKNNTRAELGHIRRLLGVGAAKTKEEEVQLILEFLIKPHDEGKNVPKKASKRKSASKAQKPAKKSKKEKAAKKMTSKETVDTESDEGEKSSESEEEEEEEEEEKEVKVTTPKKTPMKRKAVEQKMKTPTKKTKKANRVEESEERDDHSITSSSDSSEKKDEKVELIPSDKELQEKITELLKTFDLTSVSMKQMVMSVCEAFPEHPQLKERSFTIKTFIKDAIKDVE